MIDIQTTASQLDRVNRLCDVAAEFPKGTHEARAAITNWRNASLRLEGKDSVDAAQYALRAAICIKCNAPFKIAALRHIAQNLSKATAFDAEVAARLAIALARHAPAGGRPALTVQKAMLLLDGKLYSDGKLALTTNICASRPFPDNAKPEQRAHAKRLDEEAATNIVRRLNDEAARLGAREALYAIATVTGGLGTPNPDLYGPATRSGLLSCAENFLDQVAAEEGPCSAMVLFRTMEGHKFGEPFIQVWGRYFDQLVACGSEQQASFSAQDIVNVHGTSPFGKLASQRLAALPQAVTTAGEAPAPQRQAGRARQSGRTTPRPDIN